MINGGMNKKLVILAILEIFRSRTQIIFLAQIEHLIVKVDVRGVIHHGLNVIPAFPRHIFFPRHI
jgi:hypothetical protein